MAEAIAALSPMQRLEIDIAELVDLGQHSVASLVEAMHRQNVGRVVLAFDSSTTDRLQDAIAACETEGVEAWIMADYFRA